MTKPDPLPAAREAASRLSARLRLGIDDSHSRVAARRADAINAVCDALERARTELRGVYDGWGYVPDGSVLKEVP